MIWMDCGRWEQKFHQLVESREEEGKEDGSERKKERKTEKGRYVVSNGISSGRSFPFWTWVDSQIATQYSENLLIQTWLQIGWGPFLTGMMQLTVFHPRWNITNYLNHRPSAWGSLRDLSGLFL